MLTPAAVKAEETLIHVLWLNAGLSCDGDSVSLTAATQPSIEEIALGALPGLPQVAVHWPLIDFECGPAGGADDFLEWFWKADRGELEPFVLVVEGSIPNEKLHDEGGYWSGFGNNPATGQPVTTSEWLDRLAPKATAIIAAGTCATYGGIHAMAGNPTGAMGVPDYLGWQWRSTADIPIVCVPGCPVHPDNLSDKPFKDLALKELKKGSEAYTVEKMYAFLSGYKLMQDPGASFENSNVGMALLGHAIERKTTKSRRRAGKQSEARRNHLPTCGHPLG